MIYKNFVYDKSRGSNGIAKHVYAYISEKAMITAADEQGGSVDHSFKRKSFSHIYLGTSRSISYIPKVAIFLAASEKAEAAA